VRRKKELAHVVVPRGSISHLGSASWKVRKIFFSSVPAVTVPPTSGRSPCSGEEIEMVEGIGVLDGTLALHAFLRRAGAFLLGQTARAPVALTGLAVHRAVRVTLAIMTSWLAPRNFSFTLAKARL